MKIVSKLSLTGITTTLFASMLMLGTANAAEEKKHEWMVEGGERNAALELEGNWEDGLDVYEVCSACHLPEGWGSKDGTFPQIAGQLKNVIIKQMADIREGNRDNPTMYPFALPESIGDAQALADVAAYMERLKMNPENGRGEWAEGTPEFDEGKKLYADNCVECHGDHGQGEVEKYFPRLEGQHYLYMLRQFEWIRDGKRRNANPEMIEQIKGFSDKDMEMVINYVSRIPVDPADLAPSADWLNPDFD